MLTRLVLRFNPLVPPHPAPLFLHPWTPRRWHHQAPNRSYLMHLLVRLIPRLHHRTPFPHCTFDPLPTLCASSRLTQPSQRRPLHYPPKILLHSPGRKHPAPVTRKWRHLMIVRRHLQVSLHIQSLQVTHVQSQKNHGLGRNHDPQSSRACVLPPAACTTFRFFNTRAT